jgi:membrane protease YdiL (CAAX protease family)
MISLIPMGLVIVGVSILGSELDNVFRTLLPPPEWLTDMFLRLAGFETSLFGSVLALVVVAPMTEELLFRGLILRGFLSRYTVHKAVFASALLFGIFHLNPWQFLHTTIIGILFAWWFVRTKSLVPCIFGHALNNGLVFIYRDVFGLDMAGYTTPGSYGVQFQPIWLDLVGALLLVLGLSVLIHVFGKAEQPAP